MRVLYLEGSIKDHLIQSTVPMIGAVLAMMSLSLVDTWFVSLLGSLELAAMSFCFPVIMIVTGLGIGLMAATSSVLARNLGSGMHDKVRRRATDSILLGVVFALAITVIGLLSMDAVFSAMGADERTLPLIKEYMRVWYAGLIIILPPMAGFGVLRAHGDTKSQGKLMMIASLINLILDPILIFGIAGFLRFELAGAALATIIARSYPLLIGYRILRHQHDGLDFSLPTMHQLLDSWKTVLHICLPAAGAHMIIPFATGVITAFLAFHGVEVVAGFGAASKIEYVALCVFIALSAIIGPIVGQNLGAQQYQRVHESILLCIKFCLVLSIVIALLLSIAAPYLAVLFSEELVVQEACTRYLRIVSWTYGGAGIIMVINAAFNGVGKPLLATIVIITKMIFLYIPLAYFGDKLFGAVGIFAAGASANILGCVVTIFIWNRWIKLQTTT